MVSLSEEQSFFKDQFINELLCTLRIGIDLFIKELDDTDFYTSKCVGHDHYEGGTVSHSLWVLYVARNLLSKKSSDYPGVSDTNLVIVCLLHDLGDIHRGVHHRGHGRKAALFLKDVKKKFGLEITDEELAAIRFHRGHRIVDEFDKQLDQFGKTPLIRILKKADHIAAGVMNDIPFGVKPIDTPLTSKEIFRHTAIFNPAVKHWYIDTDSSSLNEYPTRKGTVNPALLPQRMMAEQFFGLNLFHFCAYDLLICKDINGQLAVFTVVSASMGYGDLYRTDRKGFGYKKVIIYFNRFSPSARAHFVVTESVRGHWSVVELTNPIEKWDKTRLLSCDMADESYNEFIRRKLIVRGCKSEGEALEAFRKSHHGIDLRNKEYYERFLIDNVGLKVTKLSQE